jgi:flagellar hook-associated protein 1 FlgK
VAETNQSIAASGGGSQANQLENQLRALIGTLATLAGVDVRMQSDGTATVSIGGVTVVQAATANTLALTTGGTPPRTSVVLGTSPAVVVPLQSGSAAGLLSAINKYLPDYRAQLNTVATALKSTTNNQLAAGYTSSGASGATYPLFVGTGAFGIAVNPAVATNPSLLAASGTSTPQAASNDGSNAQTIAELGTTPIGPDASYRALVQNIGADTQGIDSQVQAQSAVATQAQAALEGVSGVDVTTQLSNLLGLQEDYQASAKLLTIVDSTVQSLLQAVT